MIRPRTYLTLIVFTAVSLGLGSAQAATIFYGLDGDTQTGYIFDGASYSTFSIGDEYALAVGSTIRSLGNGNQGSGGPSIDGHEYTLAGTPTGASYTYPVPSAAFYDGTSDGVLNYSVDYLTGDVYSFNSDWTNPVLLFNSGVNSPIGITYDSAHKSLWISGYSSTTLYEFSLAGVALSSFSQGSAQIAGLAYDPLTGNLVFNGVSGNTLYQYSTLGNLVGSQTYVAGSPNILGLDAAIAGSAAVPEPTTWTLVSGALGMLWLGRSRLRSRQ